MSVDDALKEHSTGILATLVGLVIVVIQWLLKREIKRRDDAVADHELRLRVVESDRATKTDISGIYKTLDIMRDRAEERHLELLDRMP